MRFENSYVPYGGYWSTPFCKWQGSLSGIHTVDLAAQAARQAMAQRDISPSALDSIVLGMTVPQMLMGSVYHELSDEWSIMGNINWQNWNSFGKVDVADGY